MKLNFVFWRLNIVAFAAFAGLSSLTIVSDLVYGTPILTADKSLDESTRDRQPLTCHEDIAELTPLLLNDLPSYSNRVIQRTQDRNQAAGIENYIITASPAEFEPLNLPRIQYSQTDKQDPEQLFFTVLERKYLNGEITEIQTYHWLFLTHTDNGWHTVILFSRFGNSRALIPPAPPRETTNGIIGRGVQLWLKDCRAGTVKVKL